MKTKASLNGFRFFLFEIEIYFLEYDNDITFIGAKCCSILLKMIY